MQSANINPVDNYLAGSWEALGNGAPVLVALAQLCCAAWISRSSSTMQSTHAAQNSRGSSEHAIGGTALHQGSHSGSSPVAQMALTQSAEQSDVQATDPFQGELDGLSGEALAILHASARRGIIELKAVNTAFDAAARLLAVYVEESDERTIAFRDPHRPEVTVRFLDGFRQLCERGFIIHHIYRDFSLSPIGFEIARSVSRTRVQPWLDMATEFGLHD